MANRSPAGRRSFFVSDQHVALSRRLWGVELAVALFDAAGPLVPGNRGADMVWASPFACGSNFLLRLAGCQRKHLIVEARASAFAASGFRRHGPLARAWSGQSSRIRRGSRRLRGSRLSCPRAFAVTREHALGRFQFAELAG